MIPFDITPSDQPKPHQFTDICETFREAQEQCCRSSGDQSMNVTSLKELNQPILDDITQSIPNQINHDHVPNHHHLPHASVKNATANIIKSGIGTGVLFMPYVFKECGVFLSIVFMAVMGVFSFYCWSQLCLIIRILEKRGFKCQDQSRLTMESAIEILFGLNCKNFSIVIQLVFIFGTSVGYVIFILQTMNQYIQNPFVILLIIFAIYLPLSMFRQIEKLGQFSHLALIALCLSIFVILCYSIYTISISPSSSFSINYADSSSLPLYFGVFVFSYDINGVVTEVHASMKEKHKFDQVLFRYIVFSFSLGSILGLLGYLAFEDSVNSVVFKNFTNNNTFSTVISCLFSFSLIASILLYGFPIVKTVDSLIIESPLSVPQTWQLLAIRVVFFIVIGLLGVFVQSITNVFNLLGCVFSVILTFIIPMALLEKMKYLEMNGINLESKQIQNSISVNNNDIALNEVKKFSKQEEQLNNHKENDNLMEIDENLPRGKMNTVFNIFLVIVGIIGGISGLISSLIDLVS